MNLIVFELNLVELEFNSIETEYNSNGFELYLNLVQFKKLNSIEFGLKSIKFESNSSCMQCHSIFSFEWSLIFKYSFIISSSMAMLSKQNPKLNIYLFKCIIFKFIDQIKIEKIIVQFLNKDLRLK